MTHALFCVLFPLLLQLSSGTPVRVRHWSSFSSPFVQPRYRAIPSVCQGHIANTLMFQGFLQPFFSFDMQVGKCSIVYGVTVRSGAPNVFSTLEECRQTCCSDGLC
ncbi:hypothetical protein QR680_015239 [Steinernema hermaphroditum]|uniref:BPTI/Kunitz inhibitor domain-containing protein n=1 Tax=Steinernema hermaphroditum TaxID=289476 RepID=A0AA39LKH6_9BILA|nr:hypothetical protein QR680_015239 [Steinernema hermaphroditum]